MKWSLSTICTIALENGRQNNDDTVDTRASLLDPGRMGYALEGIIPSI